MAACLMYASFCGSVRGIFLGKYRAEYMLFFLFLGLLFAIYFGLALKPESLAQAPEKLFKSETLMAVTVVTAIIFGVTTLVDIPFLERLAEQRFISLGPVEPLP